MPGLVNAHAHSGFLRGTAEHLPVWDWLTLHINPMHRMLQPHEAEAASWLCYAESVLGGTTTVVDMWRFMEGSARAAEAIGNRLVAVPYVGEHPDYDYFDTLDMNEAMIESWHRKAGGRVNVWVGLEHLFYADEAGQRRAIDLAKKHGTGFHTHCSEAEIELAEFDKRYGKRPMFALDELGFFETPRAMIAHGVWLDSGGDRTDLETQRFGRPQSRLEHEARQRHRARRRNAGGGRAGRHRHRRREGEQQFRHVRGDEGRLAARQAEGPRRRRDGQLGSAEAWRRSLGARAIGLDHEIGSIEVGKRADIIAVRTDTPRMTPVFADGPLFQPAPQPRPRRARRRRVALTMVDGKILVEDGELQDRAT